MVVAEKIETLTAPLARMTEEQKESFARDGFLILPNGMSNTLPAS
jgi:hypothetical protein